ncbi:MAG: hypothetical protein PHV23_04535 [Candidatus Gracilibacteria bacterium]|nr:hypothetical protein [Candidatus Gracilibacteria bacterium]
MKKFLITFFVFLSAFSSLITVRADYTTDSINSFKNSVSASELNSIEDKKTRVCEEIFLRAFMRREFSDKENLVCSDIFEVKIEAQMNFMRYVLENRGIY